MPRPQLNWSLLNLAALLPLVFSLVVFRLYFKGTGSAPFLGNSTLKVSTFTVTYDTLVSPPLFRVYGNLVPGDNRYLNSHVIILIFKSVNNNSLLLSARVRLRDYYHPSNPNVAPTYMGFGYSSAWGNGYNSSLISFVPNWGMRYYELNGT